MQEHRTVGAWCQETGISFWVHSPRDEKDREEKDRHHNWSPARQVSLGHQLPGAGPARCSSARLPSDKLSAIAGLPEGHGRAVSWRGRWERPESPSAADVCLRYRLNSDAPDGVGVARYWGCCHRTLVSARARIETRHRTADRFGECFRRASQGLRRNLHCEC